ARRGAHRGRAGRPRRPHPQRRGGGAGGTGREGGRAPGPRPAEGDLLQGRRRRQLRARRARDGHLQGRRRQDARDRHQGRSAPDNSVKPGAPVLIEMVLVEKNTPFVITPETPECSAGAGDAAVTDGGDCDPAVLSVCHTAATDDWCRCSTTTRCTAFGAAPAG